MIEYTDELKDDFSDQKPCKSWRGLYTYYRRDPFYQLCRFFWCRLIGTPVAWTHAKLRFRWRVVNRQAFRQARNSSYFIYGNHTQNFFDASMCKIIRDRVYAQMVKRSQASTYQKIIYRKKEAK